MWHALGCRQVQRPIPVKTAVLWLEWGCCTCQGLSVYYLMVAAATPVSASLLQSLEARSQSLHTVDGLTLLPFLLFVSASKKGLHKLTPCSRMLTLTANVLVQLMKQADKFSAVWQDGKPELAKDVLSDDVVSLDLLFGNAIKGYDNWSKMVKGIFEVSSAILQQ